MECTYKEYLSSQKTPLDKINALEGLIDQMELSSLDSIDGGGTMSYSMDNGQMKVTTDFRSMADVGRGVLALEQMLHRYKNRYYGRVTVMRNKLNY